jgi:glutathione S-transferase
LKKIPYQLVEITPEMLKGYDQPSSVNVLSNGGENVNSSQAMVPAPATKSRSWLGPPQELLDVNPEAIIPCIKHGNWGIWESNVMMEYLEDLTIDLGQQVGGTPLLPVGQPQLKAHCRLWVDHVNRKVLPAFYALLLTPPPKRRADGSPDGEVEILKAERHDMLVDTLQTAITKLVNASHATGPFFCGASISFVDVAFAPWIIRLSRVLSYYRNFPRPEIGTRWQSWVDAVENDDRVKRTLSDDKSYHGVYRGVGEDGLGGAGRSGEKKVMVELDYARRILQQEGFGLGGDLYGRMNFEFGK